jgi:hypothetical protein
MSKVYRFRILSDEVEDFFRDLDILPGHTFLDFHNALQKELKYDPSQLASFFLADKKWEKGTEFTLFDISEGKRQDLLMMDKAVLADHVHSLKQKLLYQFDYFSDRYLYVELVEMPDLTEGKEYPLIIRRKGNPPPQIIINTQGLSADPLEDLNDDSEEDTGLDVIDDLSNP